VFVIVDDLDCFLLFVKTCDEESTLDIQAQIEIPICTQSCAQIRFI